MTSFSTGGLARTYNCDRCNKIGYSTRCSEHLTVRVAEIDTVEQEWDQQFHDYCVQQGINKQEIEQQLINKR